MTRVGFILTIGDGWLGGVNYFGNLWGSLAVLAGYTSEVVAFTGRAGLPGGLRSIPGVESVVTSTLDRLSPAWFARKAVVATGGRDLLLERFLHRSGVNVLSHSPPLARGAGIPTIGWIPDFQHFRLPGFFSARELRWRDAYYRKVCRESSLLILSSEDAKKDLLEFYPEAGQKVRVLHFVASPNLGGAAVPGFEEITSKYGIGRKYFLLPNQFWAHKNHQVVIRSLGLLNSRGREVEVVSTGSTEDYRDPGGFERLMEMSRELGVQKNFRVLGPVPHGDLLSLMRHSLAIINPSLFEGWSTTVEEAKSLGKRVILSDIPVHREQAPDRSLYFEPSDFELLSEHLVAVLSENDPSVEAEAMTSSLDELPARRETFASAYLKIVSEAMERSVERP